MFADRFPADRVSVSMITVLALFVGLSGCIGRPDLSNRAEEIAGVIAGLPGVDDIDDYYQDGFDSGRSLTYRVTMGAEATDAEVANVASTVNREVGDEFDDYDRELSLTTADFSVDLNGEPDVDELRQRLLRLQALNASLTSHAPLTSQMLTWTVNDDTDRDNELVIQEATQDPFTVLSAVRDQFGTEQMSVTVSSSDTAVWNVAFPYSPQAQNRLASVLRPLPPEMEAIRIDQDRVTEVESDVDDPATAVTRLIAIIDRVSSVTSQPWIFRWSGGQPPTGQTNLASGGMVSVGACEYHEDSPWEEDPAEHLTQDAIEVQDQLRSKYDTCG